MPPYLDYADYDLVSADGTHLSDFQPGVITTTTARRRKSSQLRRRNPMSSRRAARARARRA
jgi:hypothetical protein